MDTEVQAIAPITARIIGYRQLSEDEQLLINEIKELGEKLKSKCSEIESHLRTQRQMSEINAAERERIDATNPGRWLSIAKTDFQTGLMALTRAVAQPTTF